MKSVSGLFYFKDKIKKIIDNNICIAPPSFRVDKESFKKNNNIPDIDDKNIFSIDDIEISYFNDLKKEVNEIKSKLDLESFNSFKKKYTSIPYKKSQLIIKANNIKKDNPNFLNNITKFLYDNGIILIVKDKDEKFKYVDGFACFLGGYPIIVVYKPKLKKDYRRVFFTIAHEIYHLIYRYTENEKDADFFAGAMLLTKEDIFSVLKEFDYDIFKTNDIADISIFLKNSDDLKKVIFEKVYKKWNVSMRVILKSLINYKFIIGTEMENEYLIDNLKLKLDNNEFNADQINILSTKEFLHI
ncbi:hypothetical protein [uncultured Brachyspira sp.]|uniref:ImmA/IrrE family metallo-endopeptidase n=1 Tax=uncultured Brachyspira sp. TaxID=221953 RepID=UPI0025D08C96|nr:hypothetical protein [uncultured Brachyspira sp.]